ncbi:hypothetical protein C8Q76DRAFT_635121 [Earliella scabrosa]|nr:hypothetical protein C8Q76DRAFT_635121 [Earliella scabrosa]
MLVYQEPARAGDIEEVVMNLQGFLLESTLPPLRQFHIPRNQNRLIDMKQSVTLTGLGSQYFHSAVRGVSTIYHAFKMHLSARGCQLRTWAPECDGGESLTLTFSNRILMSAKDGEGEKKQDLGQFVDPFNVLRPLLRTEVHTAENHVDYWKRTLHTSQDEIDITFEQYKPEFFNLSNLVEVQVSFQAVRVGRHDYVFVPKMRALCLLSREAEAVCCPSAGQDQQSDGASVQDYNIAAIEAIAKAPVSPLKKIKRKVGYGDSTEEESDKGDKPPQGAMKHLCLTDRSTSSHDQLTILA